MNTSATALLIDEDSPGLEGDIQTQTCIAGQVVPKLDIHACQRF